MDDVIDKLRVNHGVWKGLRMFPGETVDAVYKEIVDLRADVEFWKRRVAELEDVHTNTTI